MNSTDKTEERSPAVLSTAGLGSAFQQAIHHAYAQTDGTYAWPNSREGDMLREAQREIERLRIALDNIASAEIGINLCIKIAKKALDA